MLWIGALVQSRTWEVGCLKMVVSYLQGTSDSVWGRERKRERKRERRGDQYNRSTVTVFNQRQCSRFLPLTCRDRNSPKSSAATPSADHSRDAPFHNLATSSSEDNWLLQWTNILAANSPAFPELNCKEMGKFHNLSSLNWRAYNQMWVVSSPSRIVK